MPITYPRAEAHLEVDSKKCAGCLSCMLACALVHEGEENLVLSRIQIIRNTFGNYPEDIEVGVCRQCGKPLCVQACPTNPKACYVNTANGNTRVIDEIKCNGCQQCIEACPFVPHTPIWNAEKKVATKCDLCINTPYWSEEGGPNGKQACVEVCPTKAIKLVKRVPKQLEDIRDNVNLREEV